MLLFPELTKSAFKKRYYGEFTALNSLCALVPCNGLYHSSGRPVSGLCGPPRPAGGGCGSYSGSKTRLSSQKMPSEQTWPYTKFLPFSLDRTRILVTAGHTERSSVCRQPALKPRGLQAPEDGEPSTSSVSSKGRWAQMFLGGDGLRSWPLPPSQTLRSQFLGLLSLGAEAGSPRALEVTAAGQEQQRGRRGKAQWTGGPPLLGSEVQPFGHSAGGSRSRCPAARLRVAPAFGTLGFCEVPGRVPSARGQHRGSCQGGTTHRGASQL